jgi:hypothetical protein
MTFAGQELGRLESRLFHVKSLTAAMEPPMIGAIEHA